MIDEFIAICAVSALYRIMLLDEAISRPPYTSGAALAFRRWCQFIDMNHLQVYALVVFVGEAYVQAKRDKLSFSDAQMNLERAVTQEDKTAAYVQYLAVDGISIEQTMLQTLQNESSRSRTAKHRCTVCRAPITLALDQRQVGALSKTGDWHNVNCRCCGALYQVWLEDEEDERSTAWGNAPN